MGFTRSITDISVHQKLGDYPNQDNGLTPEELKKRYDLPAEQLQKDLNKLEDELEAMSGAGNVGAMPLDDEDESPNNIQAKMEYLKKEIQNTALGGIPDGTVTEAKIETNFANKIAKKDGELQTGLNSEKLGGSTKEEILNSAGSFSNVQATTISGKLTALLNTWEKCIKSEELEFELNNLRYFLIRINVLSSTFNKNYENLFIYDASLGIVTPFAASIVDIEGVNFNSISPKVYRVSGPSSGSMNMGVGLAFTSREMGKINIQVALYNMTSGGFQDEGNATVQIDISSFLSKIQEV